MSESATPSIWLETPAGQRYVVTETSGIGRSRENPIFIDDHNVSRRHASIQIHRQGEVWLVDLGSKNGTSLNGRKIVWPAILNDGDQIDIGDHRFIFRQTGARAAAADSDFTVPRCVKTRCWLLLADLENSTKMAKGKSAEEWAEILSRWMAPCRSIIEKAGGRVDKYVGDGFLAYWAIPENPAKKPDETAVCLGVETRVVNALNDLRAFRPAAKMRFRVVVHVTDVWFGKTETPGEQIMQGEELNYVFRLEETAGKCGVDFGLSAAAQEHLEPLLETELVPGEHQFQGFDGAHGLFRVVGTE